MRVAIDALVIDQLYWLLLSAYLLAYCVDYIAHVTVALLSSTVQAIECTSLRIKEC